MRILVVAVAAVMSSSLAWGEMPGELFPDVPWTKSSTSKPAHKPTPATRPAAPASRSAQEVVTAPSQPQSQPQSQPAPQQETLAPPDPSQPYFLRLKVSRERLGPALAQEAATLDTLRTLPYMDKTPLEKAEAQALLALAELKAGRVAEARKQFQTLGQWKVSEVDRAARQYEQVLVKYPDGQFEGQSLAEYPVLQKASTALARQEMDRAKNYVTLASAMPLGNLGDWEKAWTLLGHARAAHEQAAALDSDTAAQQKAQIGLDDLTRKVAPAGVGLLRGQADRHKLQIIRLAGDFRRQRSGEWGPANLVAQVNTSVEAVLRCSQQIERVVSSLPADMPQAQRDDLCGAVEDVRQIRLPSTAEGRKAWRMLSAVFADDVPEVEPKQLTIKIRKI